jgi:hypothetical protein
MGHSTTAPIQEIIGSRVEIGLADLLLTIFDYAYCKGAGAPIELPSHLGTLDLLLLIEARHQAEVLALRGWLDPPILADDLPSSLLTQPQQANNPQVRAAAERGIALGDAEPPEGWLRRTMDDGRP